jgi:rhodanese-related sulfurtransferase
MMKETIDTLGNQKKMNYALRANMDKATFIKEVNDGLLPPPDYFPLNVKMNKEGYADLDAVIKMGKRALSPDAFEIAANETGAVVLDVRHHNNFIEGHIPRSIFIGLDGGFAPWVGTLIADVKQPILLVSDENRIEEAVTRLSRVGFDNTIGYLAGGFDRWQKASKEVDTLVSVPATTLKADLGKEDIHVFDVRKSSEYDTGHIPIAENTPLDFINRHLAEFPANKPFYVHCAGGYRSVIAASILKSRGIHNVIDVAGGFNAIKAAAVEVTACTSSASS